MKNQIKDRLLSAAQKLGLPTVDFIVEEPQNLNHGDFTTNIALRQEGKPIELAAKLVDLLQTEPIEGIAKVEIAGPGFINFWLSHGYLAEKIDQMIHDEKVIIEPRVGQGHKVVIEYSGPNIAKPMGVGHLRSTIIGQSLVNIYRALGYDVITTNHFGDWGTQFGKLIVAYKKWHKPDELQHNPIGHLLELYIRFSNEAKENPALEDEARIEFKKLEQGDEQNVKLWRSFKEASLQEYLTMYQLLGVTIEHQLGESDYRDRIDQIYQLLLDKKLVRQEGDALVLDLSDVGLPTTLLRKSNESSLYITRDIATLQYRLQTWQPEKILYVVAQDQSLHFQQLFAVAKKLGYSKQAELVHVGFGLVHLEGKRMRTREGHTIFLKDVIDEAIERAKQIIEVKSKALSQTERDEIARLVGIGSVKYNDLSQNQLTNIEFNWEKMLSLEGNSAPYIMYTLARARSVLEKADTKASLKAIPSLSDSEYTIMRLLLRYVSAIEEAQVQNAPHVIASYLYRLASEFNTFYAKEPILKADHQSKLLRLGLTQATASVIDHGLQLLGIAAPTVM